MAEEDTKTKIINDFYMIQDDLYAMAKQIKQYKEEIDNSLEMDNKENAWMDADDVETGVMKMTEEIEDFINMIDFPHEDNEEENEEELFELGQTIQ